jgi:hypothetical protein
LLVFNNQNAENTINIETYEKQTFELELKSDDFYPETR